MFRHFCWFVVLMCPAAVMSQDCGALGNPANGQVVAPFTTVGQTASYTCNTGYNLVGVATRTCQADDTWSGAEPTCDIVDCLVTAAPLDGNVTYNPNTLYRGYAEFSCDTGYTLSSNTRRQCQADGNWDGTTPTCNISDCGSLTTPTDGSLTLTGTTYQSVAVFACNVGYDLTGSASRTCQANTLWDGSITLCRIKDCGLPTAPGNGQVDYSSGTKYLNTATFMCNSGYNLVGVSTRTCQDDGTWETPFPTCEIKDCGSLTADANTQIDTSGGTTFGSEAVYTCDPGYEISTAQDKQTCESTGQWSATVPICSRVDCGTVLFPTDGSVDLSGGTLYQATALFSCNTGYDLTGDTSTTCQADGTWNNPTPTCVIKDCGTPSAPANGGVSLPNGTTYLSVAMFTCNMGYTMSGVADRQCLSTGSWEATFPTCTINDCGPLTPLSNTQVDTSGGTTYQSIANYTCDTGYELATSTDTRTCQSDSTWSTPEPYCTEKDCGALAPLTNGVVNFPGTLYQDVATYSCNAGYTLIGVNTQTCQHTGMWDGTTPTCEINDCGSLTSPTNGAVDTTSGTTYLQLAEYTCDTGYTLGGVTTRTCDSSGTWTATEPTCQIIDCGSLSSPANGVVTATVTTYGQTATYQCTVGYDLVGVSSRTCMSTGFWSGSAPLCQIKDCGQPQALSNAQFTVLTTTYESTANYTCDSNYGLVGSATVLCLTTGSWGTLPQCVADCGVPASITDGTVTYSMGTLEDAVATYSCNGGYTINGGATVTCGSEGSWSSAPTCSLNLGGYNSVCFTTLQCQTDRASCLDDGSGTTRCLCNSAGQIYDSDLDSCLTDCGTLTNPTNGVVVLPSITAEGQIATYSCDVGFALSGNATRVCLATGVYSDTEPSCLTGCTLPTPPENGNVSDPQGLVAGAAITYACYSGYVLVGDTSRICLTDSTFSGVAPVCKRECPVLSGVKSGTVDLSKGNYEGALATYICDKNYALKGQATRKCLSTGSWSGTEPTCIFSVFPDLVLILGLILTFLVVVDLILLTVFLYQKFIKKRIQQKKDGAEENKKKPAFLPFMLERPEKGNQPPPSYVQSPGKSTKFSNIMPEDDDDENQDIRHRRTFHPPPRKPLAPIKIERGDKPLMFTPREKKPNTRKDNFEWSTFDLDKPHMKPNTVNVNAYIPPESVSTARIEKVNPRMTGVDIKDGYNSNDSNQKQGISAPEDDRLSSDGYELPKQNCRQFQVTGIDIKDGYNSNDSNQKQGISAPEDDQLSSDGFELPKRKPVVSPPSDDVNAYFLGRMNVPPGQVTLDEPQPQLDPDRALTDESRKYMKSMVNAYSPKY